MRSAPEGYEGPLAEYAALRQELETRSTRQHQLFTAQLTIAGAIFSLALSDSRRTLLLLIVPFVSYLLASRHATQSHNSFMITRYLREDLAYRVPGGPDTGAPAGRPRVCRRGIPGRSLDGPESPQRAWPGFAAHRAARLVACGRSPRGRHGDDIDQRGPCLPSVVAYGGIAAPAEPGGQLQT